MSVASITDEQKILNRDFGSPNTLVPLYLFKHFQGYLLGNPITTRREKNYQIPYTHGMGLISDELYEVLLLLFSKATYIVFSC